MVIKNHIVWPLLMDENYRWMWIEKQNPHMAQILKDPTIDEDHPLIQALKEDVKVYSSYQLFHTKDNKLYWVTNTVLDKLDLLKVKKIPDEKFGEKYNWTVFNHVPNCRKTFILPDIEGWQNVLRILKVDSHIQFLSLRRRKNPPGDRYIWNEHCVTFFVDTITGMQCDHFRHEDVKGVEDFIYRLLCFIFLSENEEEIIKPGEKKGTRKQGKVINSFPNIPLTIINSKWNITSIRNEGFDVSGHFRVLTKKYAQPKMVWVNPYRKEGLIRKSKVKEVQG